jgi:hypothetical protein
MKPARDSKYLSWIRSFPCLVCSTIWAVEAAHVGPHGLGQKSSDHSTLPLCRRCHRTGNESLHKLGRSGFEAVHRLNLFRAVETFNQKPTVRVLGGKYVAFIHGEEFVLRPVQDGIGRSVSLALRYPRENSAVQYVTWTAARGR